MYTWFATKTWNQTSTTASAPCSVATATSFDAHSWPGPKRASWACSTLSKIPRPAAILAWWAIASLAGFGLTSATPSKMFSPLRASCWAKSTEVSMDFSNPTVLLAFATSFATRLISLCFLSCTQHVKTGCNRFIELKCKLQWTFGCCRSSPYAAILKVTWRSTAPCSVSGSTLPSFLSCCKRSKTPQRAWKLTIARVVSCGTSSGTKVISMRRMQG